LLSSGAIILLGRAGHSTLDTIRAYSESLQIPFIFFNNPSDPRMRGQVTTRSLQFFLQPGITSAIVDVIQAYEWDIVLYIYSTDEGKGNMVLI
jgi:hypothetical protein